MGTGRQTDDDQAMLWNGSTGRVLRSTESLRGAVDRLKDRRP